MSIVPLTAHLTPSCRVMLEVRGNTSLSSKIPRRIKAAFESGTGNGLIHLGAAELDTELDPSLRYWRELGREFVTAACSIANPMEPEDVVLPEPSDTLLERLATTSPPMAGAELLSTELLATLWSVMGEALKVRAAEFELGVSGYLQEADSVWHVAGRVCLHLAENRKNTKFPFAFIATYARQVKGQSELQYVPLSRALQEFAGTRNKQKLLGLLRPLERASSQSDLLRDLVDSGDVYHPLSWTADQAHAFLCQAENFETAGLVMRLPDWWSSKRRPRPQVSVTVGNTAPKALGLDAMLDFKVALTLGGKTLTKREIASLLEASAGLVLIKGQWVEVDAEKLGQVLHNWQAAKAEAAAGGVSFAEAMRMLAGTERQGSEDGEIGESPQWSEVVAGKWLDKKLDALRAPKGKLSVQKRAGLRATLRPYQVAGVEWLWTLKSLGLGGCLADDMGLGKTIQVIALLSMLKKSREDGTDLLVVPASLVENWRQELERFAPHLQVLIAHPSNIPSRKLRAMDSGEVTSFDVVVTTYGTAMRTPWIRELDWRVLALDEAQAIKNPGSKQTRAIKKLRAQWRLTLTGTPVENRLGDLWSLFDFQSPGLLGSAKDFGHLCKEMAKQPTGYEPLRTLVGPYILRRLKSDKSIISDLPEKTEMTAHCLLSKPQAALYKQSVDEMKKTLDEVEGIERRGLVLAYLMRFKQICNHPSQWLGDGEFTASHSGKFDRLAALCDPIAARQEKVLVFTQFRKMTGPLQCHLETCFGRPGLVLHGGTRVKSRQKLVEQFQNDEDIPFMILSLKAGGTGLNLTAASHVIHFDRWWNPAVENQATDRAFRIGQKRNVVVHKFVCQGTIEERIDELISSKQKLSNEVLSGGAEAKLTEMSNEELLALVKLDLHSAVTS